MTSIALAQQCSIAPKSFKNFIKFEKNASIPITPFLSGDGRKLSLKDFKGRGLVINFWATWCAPCVKEMPQLDRLAALVEVNRIQVLTISQDRFDASKLEDFFKKHKIYDLDVYLDPKSKLLRAFKLDGIPSTILVNSEGEKIGAVIGVADWDSYETVKFIRTCL